MTDQVFCASGPVRTKHRREFVQRLKWVLGDWYPGAFAFIGDPFEHTLHILTRAERVRRDPIAEHEFLWQRIDGYCSSIRAAIDAHKIPFIEAIGLDVESAIEALVTDETMKEVLRERQYQKILHRFSNNRIETPYYVRLYPSLDTIVRDIKAEFEELEDIDEKIIFDFAKNQLCAADDYFKKIPCQKDAIEVRRQDHENAHIYAATKVARLAGLPDVSVQAAAN